jgi:hypothetical protein
MNRKTTIFGMGAALAMLLCACSNPKPIQIEITTAPPSSMEINATASIAATVVNDPSNSGVDWSCTPTGACGTFTPAHTASAATTVYQAPNTAGSVTITAASTKKSTIMATAKVTINPVGSTSNLTGTYTFYANGWDAGFLPYSVAGSIAIDGANGTVTNGEQDYFDVNSGNVYPADPITSGTITLGSDGRGSLTLTPTTAPAETFSIVLVNNDHLLITEFDANATSAGSLDLQKSPASVPMSGNSFALFDPTDAFAFGGVITSSGSAITAGTGDADVGLSVVTADALGGLISATDANGRGTMTISTASLGSFEFAYYVVGPEVFRLVEIDGGSGGDFLAGSMYGQGATSGAFSAASLNGNFAFVQAGEANTQIAFYGAAGEFTADDSSSMLTAGVADVNMGDGAPVAAGSLAGSSYSVAANGYGSIALSGTTTDGLANFGIYMVDPALNLADPNSTTGGGGALLVDLDTNSVGTGIVVPQSTGATFTGNYAFNQDGLYFTNVTAGYFDILGQALSDGSSKLTGMADYNDVNDTGLNPNVAVNGTYAADMANSGRSTAAVTFTGQTTPNYITTNHITVYQASTNLLFHIDTDESISGGLVQGIVTSGVAEKQQ